MLGNNEIIVNIYPIGKKITAPVTHFGWSAGSESDIAIAQKKQAINGVKIPIKTENIVIVNVRLKEFLKYFFRYKKNVNSGIDEIKNGIIRIEIRVIVILCTFCRVVLLLTFG